ncbi:DUF1680 family protein [Bradyrhizobium sp. IAR9]|nr:DUF1680 family protein [Bradyrhizobium sp. IAR9]
MNDPSVAEVDLQNLQVSDPLIGQCQQLVREVAIPYQWEVLNDRDPEVIPSHAVENFRCRTCEGRVPWHGFSGQ